MEVRVSVDGAISYAAAAMEVITAYDNYSFTLHLTFPNKTTHVKVH